MKGFLTDRGESMHTAWCFWMGRNAGITDGQIGNWDAMQLSGWIGRLYVIELHCAL
jgi:hypothetical protein